MDHRFAPRRTVPPVRGGGVLPGFTAVGGTEDTSHVGAAELGPPCDNDVGTMIVGGPAAPGVSAGPHDDSVGNRNGLHAGLA